MYKNIILFLGAGIEQVPAIKYASENNYYVITCDNIPENPGHCYGNEYYNVSTIDEDEVLNLAKKLNVDAILSYATDSNVLTEAYVREKLGMPGNPYKSVKTLVQKDLFRAFLSENNYYTPKSKSFTNFIDLKNNISEFTFPLIIKPVDSSGSNGISKVENTNGLKHAFGFAIKYSRSKRVIVEELFQLEGSVSNGDAFLLDGKIEYYCWGDGVRSEFINPLVPVGNIYPSLKNEKKINFSISEIQRLMGLLDMKSGPLNVEFGFDKRGNFLIFDLAPRNGGYSAGILNRFVSGINFEELAIKSALGEIDHKLVRKHTLGFYADYKIHAEKKGILKSISYTEDIEKYIIYISMEKKYGDFVEKMSRQADRIGVVFLRFDSNDEMHDKIKNIRKHIQIEVV